MVEPFATAWDVGHGDETVLAFVKDGKVIGMSRKRKKPLSPRRALEFKRWHLKRMFGDRRQRVARFARLEPGHPELVTLELRKLTAKYERALARLDGSAMNAAVRDALRAQFRKVAPRDLAAGLAEIEGDTP